jgi:hypothetical protein
MEKSRSFESAQEQSQSTIRNDALLLMQRRTMIIRELKIRVGVDWKRSWRFDYCNCIRRKRNQQDISPGRGSRRKELMS